MEDMVIILFFLSIILFTYATALIDSEHIKRNQYIGSHASRFIQRLSVGLLIITLNPFYALSFGLIFWALFDQTLNYLRGNLSFWYLGKVAKTDVFFSNHLLLYKASKTISLALGIFILFYFK